MSQSKARIAAIGAGRMGRGIAHVFAYAGHEVALVDFKAREPDQAAALLAEARDEIARTLGFLASLGVLDEGEAAATLARVAVHPLAEAEAALAGADFVFEAVPEVLAAKGDAFARLCPLIAPAAIIASTTSTILVDKLAALVAPPERFLNAHWLNPAHLIPLVEVSPGPATAPETTAALTRLLEQAGKVPVVCAASPGYIVPRIQALAMNEAARMVEEGVASAEDIDRAVRVGFGVRYAVMGLVEFIDWGGGDILYYATRHLGEALGRERFSSPPVVERNMAEGRLGMGSGQGFYDFRDRDLEAYQRQRLARFVELLRHLELMPRPGGGPVAGSEGRPAGAGP
jgi:3-hydroxybutyryl-CoA dehydrogenase